jgi:1A family penicillin-binding protein
MPIPSLTTRSYGYLTGKDQSRPPFQGKEPGRRKNKKNRIFSKKNILLSLFTLGVIGFLGTTILVAWASKDLPDPNRLTDREVAQSTKIYDRTGMHLLYEIFAEEKRTLVELEDIPKDLINGLIATEDKKFYEHKGIRPLSILKAYIEGIFSSQRTRGASTITQQLVKNAILTNERSLTRKIKEAILSIRLEQKYSKDQILKIYFNEIPYGSTNYGVQSAAQSYFGKDVQDLTLSESAALAGMPQAPSRFLNDIEAFTQRRNLVLKAMFDDGHITEEQKNAAQNEELHVQPQYNNIKAPHFVLYVKELLVEKHGEALVEKGGLKVLTSLDWDKQQMAEEILGGEDGVKTLTDADANNASLVAIDPKTGHVLAMVGSRDFFDPDIDGQFNVATLGKRQPGSSFKPIIYTAAFEKGYTPDTILYDVLTNFNPNGIKPYVPTNYTLKEYGPLTMRQALAGSLNIPAVKALYLIGGAKEGINFAKRLGYTTLDSTEDCGLSLVLGCGGVSVLEHTNAYATLANNGIHYEPVTVLKVEDSSGKVIEEWKKEKGTEAIKSDVAATINNVLSDDAARSYIFGAGGILTLPGRPVAAKTGTTNNYIDAWTVGYTPGIAVGIWTGNTNNTPMKSGSSGSMLAARLWNKFMREATKDTPVENFSALPQNTAEKPVLRGSNGGSIALSVNKVTGKLVSSSTPENLIEERIFIQPHEILHYVIKENPRGPAPENPAADPQYLSWEKGIEEWIQRKKEEDPTWNPNFGEPPTEYDDAYSLELIPTLEVLSPQKNSTLSSRLIDIIINVSAPRGVSEVAYKIDGVYVGVRRSHPFNLTVNAESLDRGAHTLTIIVTDDIGNRLEENIPFSLNVSDLPAGISFSDRSLTLTRESFPTTISLSYRKIENLNSLTLYTEPLDGGERKKIGEIQNMSSALTNNELSFTWSNAPEAGFYKLLAEIITTDNETRISDFIPIEVE